MALTREEQNARRREVYRQLREAGYSREAARRLTKTPRVTELLEIAQRVRITPEVERAVRESLRTSRSKVVSVPEEVVRAAPPKLPLATAKVPVSSDWFEATRKGLRAGVERLRRQARKPNAPPDVIAKYEQVRRDVNEALVLLKKKALYGKGALTTDEYEFITRVLDRVYRKILKRDTPFSELYGSEESS